MKPKRLEQLLKKMERADKLYERADAIYTEVQNEMKDSLENPAT